MNKESRPSGSSGPQSCSLYLKHEGINSGWGWGRSFQDSKSGLARLQGEALLSPEGTSGLSCYPASYAGFRVEVWGLGGRGHCPTA